LIPFLRKIAPAILLKPNFCMMKRIAILLIFVCFFYYSIGQSISGLIKDENDKGVPSATVTLLKAKDSSATKFIVSNKEGGYIFQQIKQGDYLILVTSVGYEKNYSAIFTHRSENQTIPTIRLARGKNNLGAVTVQASRPFIEMRLDKMIVNVDASPTNAGSNVLEVLGKSPFITVDMDDNISLNGNQGVLILIDGKRTYLSPKDLATILKSMPSSNIDQIEIMTTPPAKYDADGLAGVINIKTKKSKNDGLNGSFTTSVRTAFFKDNETNYVLPNTQNNLNFNYKKKKVNLYGSTGFDSYKGRGISTYDKIYYALDGSINGYNYFVVNAKYSGKYIPLNVGVDYTPDKKNILGIATSTILHGAGNQPRDRISQVLDGNGQLLSNYTAYHIDKYNFNKATGNINWKHSIDTLGQEFSLDADYVRYRRHVPRQILQPSREIIPSP
jgi:iron complex outermembrane recepter protein